MQSFVIDATHSQTLQEFRDLVFDATVERCDELVSELSPSPDADNCSQILQPGLTEMYSITGKCFTPESGAAGDEWDDYYSLNNVISLSGNVYEIDMTFFEDVLANPRWLFADSTYIAWSGSAFQFYDVSSGDIAHALGIQSGYIPLTLNGHNVTNFAETIAAMIELFYETEFEFVVMGSAGPITLYYEIVP